MTTKEVLIKARERIKDESKWIKGVHISDTHTSWGEPCKSTARCAVGAVYSVLGRVDKKAVEIEVLAEALRDIEKTYYDYVPAEGNITIFNDRAWTTHADVMRLYDKAIARCDDGNLF